ncbi:MAG: tetratricopeptide repeat protein [Aliidongia sp.]
MANDDSVPAYHNDLGEALRVAGRLDEAAESYRAALALEPGNVAALNNLGIVEQTQGRRAAAIVLYRRAIALARDFAPAHLNLGVALLEGDDLPAAETALETARRLDPSSRQAMLNLANLRQMQESARRGGGTLSEPAPGRSEPYPVPGQSEPGAAAPRPARRGSRPIATPPSPSPPTCRPRIGAPGSAAAARRFETRLGTASPGVGRPAPCRRTVWTGRNGTARRWLAAAY